MNGDFHSNASLRLNSVNGASRSDTYWSALEPFRNSRRQFRLATIPRRIVKCGFTSHSREAHSCDAAPRRDFQLPAVGVNSNLDVRGENDHRCSAAFCFSDDLQENARMKLNIFKTDNLTLRVWHILLRNMRRQPTRWTKLLKCKQKLCRISSPAEFRCWSSRQFRVPKEKADRMRGNSSNRSSSSARFKPEN